MGLRGLFVFRTGQWRTDCTEREIVIGHNHDNGNNDLRGLTYA